MKHSDQLITVTGISAAEDKTQDYEASIGCCEKHNRINWYKLRMLDCIDKSVSAKREKSDKLIWDMAEPCLQPVSINLLPWDQYQNRVACKAWSIARFVRRDRPC